jgi:hypothetical protein
MTRLTDRQTDAALAEPLPFPQPVQFAGVEPADNCAECMQLRAELASARQQIDHLSRLALRSRSTAAGR